MERLGRFAANIQLDVLTAQTEQFTRDRYALHRVSEKLWQIKVSYSKNWRRGSGSNRRIKVLQTSPLPLGYRAPGKDNFCRWDCITIHSAVANPAGAGGRNGAGDEI